MQAALPDDDALPPLGAAAFTLAFALGGILLEAVAFGWVTDGVGPLADARGIAGALGVSLLGGACLPHVQRRGADTLPARLACAATTLPLAAIFNWIAFGPGSRQFATRAMIGEFAQAQTAADLTGRFFFGTLAIAVDAFIVVRLARHLRRPA